MKTQTFFKIIFVIGIIVLIIQILELDFDNIYSSLITDRKFIGISASFLAVMAIWFENKKIKKTELNSEENSAS